MSQKLVSDSQPWEPGTMARVLARGVVQELSLGGHLQSQQGSELSSLLFGLFFDCRII